MAQKYNIYINQKALIITLVLPSDAKDYQIIDSQGFDFEKFYRTIDDYSSSSFYLITESPSNLFKTIKKTLRIIEAAGGFVESEEGKFLFIKRSGKWDLPKGKLEIGEKKKEAAVREVEEECGLKVQELGKKLLKTYHVYEIKGNVILKISHWYKMKSKSKQKLIPQLEEGITEVKWIAPKNWDKVKVNTYPSILEVLSVA
jgi:8-oxo-dGTP pyrophosphatase MutT (NUDIX family)